MIDCPPAVADALLLEARTIEIDDARRRFRPGTVVRHRDGSRGTVVRFIEPGDRGVAVMVGDIEVRFSAGHSRVSNRYSEWEVVPEAEQTLVERVRGILLSHPGDPEPDETGWFEREETLAWKLLVALADLDDAACDRVFPWGGDWPLDLGELALLLAREGDRRARRCSCRVGLGGRPLSLGCAVHGLA